MSVGDLTFREGRRADLRAAYGLFDRAVNSTAGNMGATAVSHPVDEQEIEANWQVDRPLVEFMAAQPGGSFWVCENEEGLAGFARVVRFGRMEELTEVSVDPAHHGRGIGRGLLERCWPGDPTQATGRIVVAAGSVVDLGLYMGFGVMPITGHWHLEQPTERYVERRSQQIDRDEPAVHALEAGRAVDEWKRLEPAAIGHERPELHDFFGRERTCLATMGADDRASGLCWLDPAGQIGPAVGERPQDLVPVVLAALDRVAKMQEPEHLHVFCTTDSWWLLRRLGGLGFRVSWPSWVMCSEPLPGLDRYLPTRPALVL
jgi:GNAT superfamily N-acetyltransferase